MPCLYESLHSHYETTFTTTVYRNILLQPSGEITSFDTRKWDSVSGSIDIKIVDVSPQNEPCVILQTNIWRWKQTDQKGWHFVEKIFLFPFQW